MSDNYRPFTPAQALSIIRECHTHQEIDKATDLLYPSAKSYDLFDLHLISQALKFKYKKLNTLEK